VKEIRKEAKNNPGLADVLRPIDMNTLLEIVGLETTTSPTLTAACQRCRRQITAIARQLVEINGKLTPARAYDSIRES